MTEFEIPEEAMEDLENKLMEALSYHNNQNESKQLDEEAELSEEEDACFRSDHKVHLDYLLLTNPLQMAFSSL